MLLPLLLIPVLYFVMIRPQQKRQKQWQSMLSSVKPGDKVRYNGAVHVAQHVVHRHGETVVQLQGQNALIPLEKLRPA